MGHVGVAHRIRPRAARSLSSLCMRTVSSQRWNLKPTDCNVPTWRKPSIVKPDRGKIPAVADDGNDLVKISDRTLGKKGAHQASTQALSHAIRTNVDRIFNRVPVGRPHPIRPNMGVADDSAVPLGDKVRKSFVEEVAASPDHFGVVRWFDLKGAGRVQD